MRFFQLTFLISLISFWLNAQPSTKNEESVHWYYNIEEARSVAQQEHKDVLIYFSGSDWCKPCIQLRERILNTESWSIFADKHLVMVQADFPRLKKNQISKEQIKHNEGLAELYNKQGVFPLIVILDSTGDIRCKVSYQEETPQEFEDKLSLFLK